MKKFGLFLLAVALMSAVPPYFDSKYPNTHDPVMACEDGVYYIYSTGMGIGVISSPDMINWERRGGVLQPIPQWAMDSVPAYKGHTWAPDIQRVGDKWVLYYSCSGFGKNLSAIGVAFNKTLNPDSADYKWEDQGLVIKSTPRKTNWNAIDPNLIFDEDGSPWLTFGSFWDGIQLVRLAEDLKTPIGEPVTIARRNSPEALAMADGNAIEAPFIAKRGDYYYLFVSYDFCCRGLSSTYKTAVGRSKSIEGPYLDKKGVDMCKGGGTLLVGETDRYAGVGHCSVYEYDGTWYMVAHGYDKQLKGASKLYLKKIAWKKGWPKIVQ